ncbi:MAG: hypothetical protein ABI539_15650 [Acidobacteriota bacterium]
MSESRLPEEDMAVIEGNPSYIPEDKFKPKVEKALKLLKSKAAAYSTWFDSYGLKIRAAAKSGANFKDGAIDIGLETFNASETWLASVIIHESVHFWQYRSGKYKAGTEAETEANRYQMGVLQLVGAPSAEIHHMQKQDGGHADINGDGVYDWKDYDARKY